MDRSLRSNTVYLGIDPGLKRMAQTDESGRSDKRILKVNAHFHLFGSSVLDLGQLQSRRSLVQVDGP